LPVLAWNVWNRISWLSIAVLTGKQLDILDTYPYECDRVIQDVNERGDGTVPSFSSVPIEWSDTNDALTLADKHAAMQSATTARDSILNWLRPIDVRQMKGSSVNDASVVELTVPQTPQCPTDDKRRLASNRPVWIDMHLVPA